MNAIASLEKTLGHKLSVHPSYWQFNVASTNELSAIATNPTVQDDIDKGRIPLISPASVISTRSTRFRRRKPSSLCRLGSSFVSLGSSTFTWGSEIPGATTATAALVKTTGATWAPEEAEFIAYFRHIVEVFREYGVDAFSSYPVAKFYPGDEYVDWIAGDAYDSTGEPTRGFLGIWTSFWNAFHLPRL